jgi:hypothetical protein
MSNHDFESWTSEEITRIQTGTNLRRPSDHQSMFKYISLNTEASWEHLHRTLHYSELFGSAASNLNDPFEVSPYIFDDLQPTTIAEAVRYRGHSALSDGKAAPLQAIFPDPEPYRQQALSFLGQVASHFRIIAFCERVDSSLLWSHYANSYQGACLHFLAKGFSWHRRYTLGHVAYSQYRPALPLSLALALSSKPGGPTTAFNATPLKRAESEKLLFFTKADDWSYESEIRLIYDPKESATAKFQQDSLVAIITGPKFSGESRRKLENVIQGSRYENISLRRARLSKTTFSVEVEEEPAKAEAKRGTAPLVHNRGSVRSPWAQAPMRCCIVALCTSDQFSFWSMNPVQSVGKTRGVPEMRASPVARLRALCNSGQCVYPAAIARRRLTRMLSGQALALN